MNQEIAKSLIVIMSDCLSHKKTQYCTVFFLLKPIILLPYFKTFHTIFVLHFQLVKYLRNEIRFKKCQRTTIHSFHYMLGTMILSCYCTFRNFSFARLIIFSIFYQFQFFVFVNNSSLFGGFIYLSLFLLSKNQSLN